MGKLKHGHNLGTERKSRGQRKRTKKRENLLAKKQFVELLTKKKGKRKRDKMDGKLQVQDVSKVLLEEVTRTAKEANQQGQSAKQGGKKQKGQKNVSKKAALREELSLFKQVSSHPAFQQMGISAIRQHLQNSMSQGGEQE